MRTKENKKEANEISVIFEFGEDSFIIYDEDYNQLANGIIYVNYEEETNSYYLGSVEVYDNYIFENNERVEHLVSENFGFGNIESDIELTNKEMKEYNSQYNDDEDDEELKRKDASNDCMFDLDSSVIKFINPYNANQSMWVDEDGLMMVTSPIAENTGKSYNQKIVWKRVRKIEDLSKGDFVKLVHKHYKSEDNEDEAIVTDVNLGNGYIKAQYFLEEGGVSLRTFRIESYNEIYKAVYLGEKKWIKKTNSKKQLIISII